MDQLAVEPEARALNAPSHSRTALSAIVSKTGWTSVGELLITRRISLVAVCCSSASVSARQDRAGSDAAGPGGSRERLVDGGEVLSGPTVVGREVDQVAVEEEDSRVLGGAQPAPRRRSRRTQAGRRSASY